MQCNVTAVIFGPQTTIPVWRYDAAPSVRLSLQPGPDGACAVASLFAFCAPSAAAAAVAPVSCISLCCVCFMTSILDAAWSTSVFSVALVPVFIFFQFVWFQVSINLFSAQCCCNVTELKV